MKTELKDVIHLYLGCNIEYADNPKDYNNTINFHSLEQRFFGINVKPILRPLSSMTEDEQAIVGIEYYFESILQMRLDDLNWTTSEFLYLLKRGFDLFGLIESGQAIDKTKM